MAGTLAIVGADLTCAIIVVAAVYFGPLTWLRRDRFRTDIRAIRDELFDFIIDRGLNFSDPAYQDTRRTLNAIIRYSDRFGIYAFLVVVATPSDRAAPPQPVAETSSPELRKKIADVRARTARRLMTLVLGEGIVGGLIWMLAKLPRRSHHRRERIVQRNIRELVNTSWPSQTFTLAP